MAEYAATASFATYVDGDCVSVAPGDLLDLPDATLQRLLKAGLAEVHKPQKPSRRSAVKDNASNEYWTNPPPGAEVAREVEKRAAAEAAAAKKAAAAEEKAPVAPTPPAKDK